MPTRRLRLEELPRADAFSMGVAAGDVGPSRAVLWTRYRGPRRLALIVVDESGRTRAWPAPRAPGGYVHVDAGGLRPRAEHRYAFVTLDGGRPVARSAIGRFRAAWEPEALAPLTVGATSCANYRHDYAVLERAAERADFDVFVSLGDTTYADGCEALCEYRAAWSEDFAKPAWRALRERTSLLATWDDHEVANDWDPVRVDPRQLRAARRALHEALPLRAGRLYKSFRYGRTAEIFVLDCRGEREPSSRRDEDARYISRRQLRWLLDGLRRSPARFKVIMSSVPIGEMPGLLGLRAPDRWEGYPAQRARVLRFIRRERVRGVVWLSGDLHIGTIGRVAPHGRLGDDGLEVLAGPAAQVGNPLASQLHTPQFDFVTTENNYVTLALDPLRMSVRVRFVDRHGAVFHEREIAR